MNYYLRVAVGSLFVILGIYMMFLDILPGTIDPRLMTVSAVVLVAYGIYRIVHSKLIKAQERETTHIEDDIEKPN